MNSKKRRRGGFSIIELLITATILTIVTAFGLIGITKARAAVRLSGAAREYASYVEKARIFSIRRHADIAAQRATVAINADRASYDVTLDLDGDGGMDTRTVTLPSGVSFETVESIAFDWRGRTFNTVGGVTTPNAQVSIRLRNGDDSVSVDVTGSGDITIDSRVFDDAVPSVTLHVTDLAANATPTPALPITTPTPTASPLPVSTPSIVVPSPTPTPNSSGNSGNSGSGNSGNSGSGNSGSGGSGNSGSPTPTPTPAPTPTPTPTPAVCTILTDLQSLVLHRDSTSTVRVSHDGNSSLSLTATSSKPSDLQVTPGGAQTVGAGASTSFTIKSKRSTGVYYVTFSTGCGQKILAVTVVP